MPRSAALRLGNRRTPCQLRGARSLRAPSACLIDHMPLGRFATALVNTETFLISEQETAERYRPFRCGGSASTDTRLATLPRYRRCRLRTAPSACITTNDPRSNQHAREERHCSHKVFDASTAAARAFGVGYGQAGCYTAFRRTSRHCASVRTLLHDFTFALRIGFMGGAVRGAWHSVLRFGGLCRVRCTFHSA